MRTRSVLLGFGVALAIGIGVYGQGKPVEPPIRQFDEQIRLTERFAGALSVQRTGDIRHSNLEMVRQRI